MWKALCASTPCGLTESSSDCRDASRRSCWETNPECRSTRQRTSRPERAIGRGDKGRGTRMDEKSWLKSSRHVGQSGLPPPTRTARPADRPEERAPLRSQRRIRQSRCAAFRARGMASLMSAYHHSPAGETGCSP
eukprot:scaffold733_cov267-Pinguiococcus_pyrenoidosus.AAC.40